MAVCLYEAVESLRCRVGGPEASRGSSGTCRDCERRVLRSGGEGAASAEETKHTLPIISSRSLRLLCCICIRPSLFCAPTFASLPPCPPASSSALSSSKFAVETPAVLVRSSRSFWHAVMNRFHGGLMLAPCMDCSSARYDADFVGNAMGVPPPSLFNPREEPCGLFRREAEEASSDCGSCPVIFSSRAPLRRWLLASKCRDSSACSSRDPLAA
mmetsp:Transcript_10943/g.25764  ORF Transcript_10943/g.25764 Transcript_10943/m.25764 type:complete len:214 (-) Transcript_10943:338-979(-)